MHTKTTEGSKIKKGKKAKKEEYMSEESEVKIIDTKAKLEEDKNSSGLTDAIGEDNLPNSESKGNAKPLFFLDDDVNIEVGIHVFYNKETGKIERVVREELLSDEDAEDIDFWGYSKENFTFSMPTYEELTKHRRICQYFNADAQRTLVDALALRERLLVWQLKDWTIRDGKGNKVELIFDKDGSLSTKSLEKINKIPSGILDIVMTQMEKQILLS